MLAFVNRDTNILQEMRFATTRERTGPAFTAVIDDKIIGCGGVMIMWAGVGHAWVAFSKDIEPYPVWFTRTIRCALSDIIRGCKLHRVEAVVLADQGTRWLQSLGFRVENDIAQAYTEDKRDVVRMEFVS